MTIESIARRRAWVTVVCLALAGLASGCTVLREYAPTGERSTQARVRVMAVDRYVFSAFMFVKTEADDEPREQMLAAFSKGWMGMGKVPKGSELIGMPAFREQDTNMPVVERYVTGNQPLRIRYTAKVDGTLICGGDGAFKPVAGHDYELVVSMLSTSIGFRGECGLIAYELVAKGDAIERVPLLLIPLPTKSKR